MKIFDLLESILIEQHQIDKLKEKYLGDMKPGEKHRRLTNKEFDEISNVTDGNFTLTAWLTIKVAHNIIHHTDIYKFKDYFKIFEKNKNKFQLKDINQYKTKEQIQEFIGKCIEIREKNVNLTTGIEKGDEEKYISPNDIQKLENAGLHYLGISDGYQIFEIPNELKDNENSWKIYKDILGKCAGRDQGATIDICTIANFSHFSDYLKEFPGSSYFIMFNLGDPLSPYQIHFESNQFMDKNNKPQIQYNESI